MTNLDIFESRKVLILGDVMLDRYWWGTVNRISPEAPVPVIRLEKTTAAPGGAANVAANVKSLGAEPILLGVIGRDDEGSLLADALTSIGISAEHLSVANGRPTSVKTRIIAHSQQVARVDRETTDALAVETAKNLISAFESALDFADVVLVSDYAKGALCDSVLRPVISLAEARGVPVLVDPKGKDFKKYRGATILTPNRREAAEACKLDEHEPNVTYLAGNMLLAENWFANVLITESENGMTLFTRGDGPVHYDAIAHEVYDVTGAGDTVIATLAVGIAAGMDFAESARIANVAAGIAVGQIGAVSVRRDQLSAALDRGL